MKLPIENRKYANEITADNAGEHVCIAGWVHEKRDLGGVFFLIVRDFSGFAQVTLHKGEVEQELFERVKKVPRESVVSMEGKVKSEKKSPKKEREKDGRKSMLARLLGE